MKRRWALAAVLLALAAVSPALAGGEPRETPRRGPDRFDDIAATPGLHLTAEQNERLLALREAHLAETKPLRDRIFAKGRALRELWLAQTPDRERITALLAEVQALREQLHGKIAGYRQEARRFLTPEQREKLEAFERETGRRHEQRRFGRPPGGGLRPERAPGDGRTGKGGRQPWD